MEVVFAKCDRRYRLNDTDLIDSKLTLGTVLWMNMCVCITERENERERECECEGERGSIVLHNLQRS